MGHGKYSYTRIDLETKLDACIGKTLGDVDSANVFGRAKGKPKITGIAGNVVEQSIIGYPPNSSQEPDLLVDGVDTELKTTGLKRKREKRDKENEVAAKEPMSITAVSLDRIASETFETSMFWHKAEHMLIVYYLYDAPRGVSAAEYASFPIMGYQFHEFSAEERDTLRSDWQLIHDYIEKAQATCSGKEELEEHYKLLSRALRKNLMLLDTAPKYPNSPRFRLKQKTVTTMAQKAFGESFEQLPSSYVSVSAIDCKLSNIARRFRKKTMGQMADELGVKYSPNRVPKNIAEHILVAAFGGKSKKMSDVEAFAKAGITCKTVVLTPAGELTEDMKFASIDFDEFGPDAVFEDSMFAHYFDEMQLICPIFREPFKNAPLLDAIFLGFKRLVFPEYFTEYDVRPVWERMNWLIVNEEVKDVVIVKKGTDEAIVNKKTGVMRSAPNFPKKADGFVFVRGSGRDSSKKDLTICGIEMYRQNLWLSRHFLAVMLDDAEII